MSGARTRHCLAIADVPLEGAFLTEGTGFASALDGSFVNPTRELDQFVRPIANHVLELRRIGRSDVGEGRKSRVVELLPRYRADAPQPPNREWVEKPAHGPGRHEELPVRFRKRAGNLRHELVGCDANAHGQARYLTDAALDVPHDVQGSAEEAERSRYVEERLVEGERLDLRRDLAED